MPTARSVHRKKLQTKSWAFKVCSTILSMIAVESWLVYHGWHENTTHLLQSQFYNRLATQLIDLDFQPNTSATEMINVLLMPITGRRNSRNGNNFTSRGAPKNQALQRRCKICSKKTTKMCANKNCASKHSASSHSTE